MTRAVHVVVNDKCVATLVKDFSASLLTNHWPNVATVIFMPRATPSLRRRSQALSTSVLG
jgi:hypothetical protein